MKKSLAVLSVCLLFAMSCHKEPVNTNTPKLNDAAISRGGSETGSPEEDVCLIPNPNGTEDCGKLRYRVTCVNARGENIPINHWFLTLQYYYKKPNDNTIYGPKQETINSFNTPLNQWVLSQEAPLKKSVLEAYCPNAVQYLAMVAEVYTGEDVPYTSEYKMTVEVYTTGAGRKAADTYVLHGAKGILTPTHVFNADPRTVKTFWVTDNCKTDGSAKVCTDPQCAVPVNWCAFWN